jgi:hypothetical protein
MRNNLGTSESPYYALAAWSKVVDSEAFIDRMAAGRTTLSKTDILAVFQLAREELSRLLAEGYYVKTPLGAALPVAKGRFSSPDDSFLPKSPDSGHELRIAFRIDPTIEAEALASIQCIRDKEGDRRSPHITAIASLPSENSEEAVAGGLVRISGARMKFDPVDSRLGLVFRDEAGRETRAETYALAQPSSVIAIAPTTLEAGAYRLLIRTISKGGALLEGISSGTIRISGTG